MNPEDKTLKRTSEEREKKKRKKKRKEKRKKKERKDKEEKLFFNEKKDLFWNKTRCFFSSYESSQVFPSFSSSLDVPCGRSRFVHQEQESKAKHCNAEQENKQENAQHSTISLQKIKQCSNKINLFSLTLTTSPADCFPAMRSASTTSSSTTSKTHHSKNTHHIHVEEAPTICIAWFQRIFRENNNKPSNWRTPISPCCATASRSTPTPAAKSPQTPEDKRNHTWIEQAFVFVKQNQRETHKKHKNQTHIKKNEHWIRNTLLKKFSSFFLTTGQRKERRKSRARWWEFLPASPPRTLFATNTPPTAKTDRTAADFAPRSAELEESPETTVKFASGFFFSFFFFFLSFPFFLVLVCFATLPSEAGWDEWTKRAADRWKRQTGPKSSKTWWSWATKTNRFWRWSNVENSLFQRRERDTDTAESAWSSSLLRRRKQRRNSLETQSCWTWSLSNQNQTKRKTQKKK